MASANDASPEESPSEDGLTVRAGHLGFTSRYWWLLSATGTSGLGNGLVLVAFPLLAVHLTRQPLQVAGVAVAGQLPWLIVSLPAGALADRVDRRRLVVAIELLRALALTALGLAVLGQHGSLLLLDITAFTVGALETTFSAATRATLAALVRTNDLPRANGYLFAAETAGEQFAGPALGGLIFAWARAAPFLGDGVSFAGSAALLTKALPGQSQKETSTLTLRGDLRVALRWFRHHSLLRRLAPVLATFAFCQSVVLSVLVLYGVHDLHLSSGKYGIFLAVGASGDVVGSLLAQRAHALLGPTRAILISGIAAASGYLILASTSNVAVAIVGYALEAMAVALGNVATLSLRQQLIPTQLFGRINNIFRTFVYGAIPAGALAGGFLAAAIGLHATFLTAGLLQLLLIAISARRLATEVARFIPPVTTPTDQPR